MVDILTHTQKPSQKHFSAMALLAFFTGTLGSLACRRSSKQKIVQMSERDLKTLSQVHPEAQKLYARPLSVDVATDLTIRANGHSMLR